MPTLFGLRSAFLALKRSKPEKLYYTNGGIGDELMLTAIARAARAAGRPISAIATYPELWRGNSDPLHVETDVARWQYASLRGWLPTQVIHLSYRNGQNRHIAQQMAEHLDLTLPSGWRPVLPAVSPVPRDPTLIVVQNSCRGARYAADTKEWAQSRWRELVGALEKTHRLVQLGSPHDPPLSGTQDLRGKTTLLGAAELLAQATLFIGLESGLQHFAAAVQTPSVIIYGGRTRPHETGYAFNTNIVRTPPCAGCALNTGCPNHLICLEIPATEVLAAVHRTLASPAPTFSAHAG
jgi:hypothetical protein